MNEQDRLAAILGGNQGNNGVIPRLAVNNNQMQIPQQRQQSPYQGNNMNGLLQNTPFDNYMGYNNNNNSQGFHSNNYFFKGRPVSSKEEARVAQIDLDGSLWIFMDISHGRIYTKQILNDASSDFKTYILQEEDDSGNEYVTKNDLSKVIQYFQNLIPAVPAQPPVQQAPKSDKAPLNF